MSNQAHMQHRKMPPTGAELEEGHPAHPGTHACLFNFSRSLIQTIDIIIYIIYIYIPLSSTHKRTTPFNDFFFCLKVFFFMLRFVESTGAPYLRSWKAISNIAQQSNLSRFYDITAVYESINYIYIYKHIYMYNFIHII